MVFDGYSNSPNDHDHIRSTKNSCCDAQIQPNKMHLTSRVKFVYNTHNKDKISHFLSAFQKHQITVELGDNDSDTSFLNAALVAGTRYCFCCNCIQHVLMKGSSSANQTGNSTSNRGCSCPAFSPYLSSNPGLNAIAEHVYGPEWLIYGWT